MINLGEMPPKEGALKETERRVLLDWLNPRSRRRPSRRRARAGAWWCGV